jgi:hypothetical protein
MKFKPAFSDDRPSDMIFSQLRSPVLFQMYSSYHKEFSIGENLRGMGRSINNIHVSRLTETT